MASDWARGCHRNGKPLTIRIVGSSGSHMTGNDVMGTGSDVFLNGKPLTSIKKGWWAHGTGSHVFSNGKPLASLKIGSGAQGGLKPRRKRGLKVQSPISATGVT